ncbi:MAG: hypothetical protein Ct9H90mP22_6350 [Gammaproteobacteria bacterium]|nr:MAG: hypothetical protein Ct9H90mP22_6350 [Gammaproteobacteria bacterium]
MSLEKSFDKNEISKLKKMGHKFQYDLGGFGGYQAIMIRMEYIMVHLRAEKMDMLLGIK